MAQHVLPPPGKILYPRLVIIIHDAPLISYRKELGSAIDLRADQILHQTVNSNREKLIIKTSKRYLDQRLNPALFKSAQRNIYNLFRYILKCETKQKWNSSATLASYEHFTVNKLFNTLDIYFSNENGINSGFCSITHMTDYAGPRDYVENL